ncbi:MAG TPA: hypothetical protein VI728_05000, partial [Syntrophales bacterium]|nr:hypothetical protein [Syntrophales bacterium]
MHKVARLLLKWYRSNRILYPWRFTKDPYRVWLSEVLLQQTRIPVVLQYYEKILHQFPSLQALASARDSDFLSAWSGLGYYRRAHNMLRCARELVSRHNGRFPLDLQTLQSLPGIGPYTAGAIRNICFDLLTPTADGNISRVLARITNNRHRMSTHAFRTEIARSFLEWGQDAPPGEYLQSLMELGEQICLPKPECPRCPMQKLCLAYKKRSVLKIPQRPVKK